MANDQETGTAPSNRSALTLRGQSKTRLGVSSTSFAGAARPSLVASCDQTSTRSAPECSSTRSA